MLGAASNLSWRQLEKPRLKDADFYFGYKKSRITSTYNFVTFAALEPKNTHLIPKHIMNPTDPNVGIKAEINHATIAGLNEEKQTHFND